nr:hypothetical protein [Brucella abortus]
MTRVNSRHCHARTAGNHKSVRIQKGVTGYEARYFQIWCKVKRNASAMLANNEIAIAIAQVNRVA